VRGNGPHPAATKDPDPGGSGGGRGVGEFEGSTGGSDAGRRSAGLWAAGARSAHVGGVEDAGGRAGEGSGKRGDGDGGPEVISGQSLYGGYDFPKGGSGSSQSRISRSGVTGGAPPLSGGGHPHHGRVPSLNAWGNSAAEIEQPAERPPRMQGSSRDPHGVKAADGVSGTPVSNGFHFDKLPEPKQTALPAWTSQTSPTEHSK
jgi:hypothetical protein